ncbi:MAG: nucleoside hydrolase [Microbacterium sp.]|uniref:nucleoside hydrolase n=1 Tax=Microbacterium sp. TaxID=51671 RepID=UPI003D6EC593
MSDGHAPLDFLDYTVPASRRVRAVISSDVANEADDQFAIAHALLTPKIEVVAVVSTHYGSVFVSSEAGERASFDEARVVVDLVGTDVPVVHGSPRALPSESEPVESDGARRIIEEAHKDDPRPLFVLIQGPATDLASALLLDPSIASELTAIWIGGGSYPRGGREFNVGNDLHAANVLLASGCELWQVPVDVYSQMSVSLATLAHRVARSGELGAFLWQRLRDTSAHLTQFVSQFPYLADMHPNAMATVYPTGEVWHLGDSPVVGLLLSGHEHHYEEIVAPRIAADGTYESSTASHKIRVYRRIEAGMILEDMYAKLALHAEAVASS